MFVGYIRGKRRKNSTLKQKYKEENSILNNNYRTVHVHVTINCTANMEVN